MQAGPDPGRAATSLRVNVEIESAGPDPLAVDLADREAAGRPVVNSLDTGIVLLAAMMATSPVAAQDHRFRCPDDGPRARDQAGDLYVEGDREASEAVLRAYVESCEHAARDGNASAQVEVAWAYALGEGVPEDLGAAADWARKAAEHGDAEGQWLLGDLLNDDNPAEAFTWYQRAAEQGNSYGARHVGLMYTDGVVVPRDFVRASMWLQLSIALAEIEMGHPDYIQFGKELLEEVKEQMTAVQIADAERLAREWFKKHPGRR